MLMIKCPNKNTEEWKLLVDNLGEINAYRAFIANNDNLPTLDQVNNLIKEFENRVNYNLKLTNSLIKLSNNRGIIRTNTKDKPYIEKNITKVLSGQGVPLSQIKLMFDYLHNNNIKEISTIDLALELSSKFSYTIEVNTAKDNSSTDIEGSYISVAGKDFKLSGIG